MQEALTKQLLLLHRYFVQIAQDILVIKSSAIVVVVRKEEQGGDSLQEGSFEKDALAASGGRDTEDLCFTGVLSLKNHLF